MKTLLLIYNKTRVVYGVGKTIEEIPVQPTPAPEQSESWWSAIWRQIVSFFS
jgi:hypothetical protein